MNSKKIFVITTLFLLLSLFFVPNSAMAWVIGEPIVPQSCGQNGIVTFDADGNCTSGPTCPCGIVEFFLMISNIYSFIVLAIATPLAVIALIVGGIMILISAGNANLLGMGKKIIYSAIIGLVLVFCSWIIIDFIMQALGYTGSWFTLPS